MSAADRAFVLGAVARGQRADGRERDVRREVQLSFGRGANRASVEVVLGGGTRVLAVVAAEMLPPAPDRPTEGFITFHVNLTAAFRGEGDDDAGDAGGGGAGAGGLAAEMSGVLERAVIRSQTMDTEALCIVAGEKVWAIRCDVHVLAHDGNLTDAAVLAAIAALRHYRQCAVTVASDGVVVHSPDEKEPTPLALHHSPFSVTFALFHEGNHIVTDPTLQEERFADGLMTMSLNAHRELCTMYKTGGEAVPVDALLRCADMAANHVEQLHSLLNRALNEADVQAQRDKLDLLSRRLQPQIPPPSMGVAPMTAPPPSVDSAGMSGLLALMSNETRDNDAAAAAAAAAAAGAAAVAPGGSGGKSNIMDEFATAARADLDLRMLDYALLHEPVPIREDEPAKTKS